MLTEQQKFEAAREVVVIVGEAVRDLTAASPLGGVPSGELYARLMGSLSLDGYNMIIGVLKNAGAVVENNYLLSWTGKVSLEQVKSGVDQAQAGEVEIPEHARHLAAGSSATTMCGIPRETVTTAHPSKARKNDCPACREAWRLLKNKSPKFQETSEGTKPAPVPEEPPAIQEPVVENPDFEPSASLCPACAAGTERNEQMPAHILHGGHTGEYVDAEGKNRICECCQPQEAKPEPTPVTMPPPRAGSVTEEERKQVLEMRAAGMGYEAIEKAMNWKPQHGNKPWRICNPPIRKRDLQ